jgi:hypothetical protein
MIEIFERTYSHFFFFLLFPFRITKENEIIKEQNRNLFLENQRLEKQNSILQQRISFLERKLVESDKTIASHRQQLSECLSKIQQLRNELSEAKKLDAKYTLAVQEKLYVSYNIDFSLCSVFCDIFLTTSL